MKLFINIFIFISLIISAKCFCQINDSTILITNTDTIVKAVENKTSKTTAIQSTDTILNESYKPDPIRVLWMGAIIPGYGQFLNRKYWKLPIVYAGFLGFAYTISFNSIRYQAYKNAYRDIKDTDETTNSFLDILPEGYTVDTYGGMSAYTNILNTGMEKSRYNRDLSVIALIAYYGITLVDAYVDAQLFDFDISNDLSLNLKPVLISNQYGYKSAPGLQFSFCLK